MFALMLSLIALKLASKPVSTSRTFGYHRTEVFSALINGISLLVISTLIFKEAYVRAVSPPHVKSAEMLVIALVGLLGNLFVVIRLKEHSSDLNIKSAFLHALGDAISSIGVIGGAVIIMFTGYYIADPAVSILIGAVILVGSLGLIRESTHILLEGTPPHVDIERVARAISSVPGVKGLHDFHVWCICPHICAASGCVVVEDAKLSDVEDILEEIKRRLFDFDIVHTTFQFECVR